MRATKARVSFTMSKSFSSSRPSRAPKSSKKAEAPESGSKRKPLQRAGKSDPKAARSVKPIAARTAYSPIPKPASKTAAASAATSREKPKTRREAAVARLAITSVAESGAGIGETEFKGRPVRVFVPGALPGDTVEAVLLPGRQGSHSLFGRISGFVEKSAARRAAPGCALHELCGGCPLSPLKYEAQLALKKSELEKLFQEAPELSPEIAPVMPATLAGCASRNKSVLHFAGRKGALTLGLFAQGTHRVEPATIRCPQCPAWMEKAARALLEAANRLQLDPWEEEAGEGLLRSVLMREGAEGERLFCLVASRRPSEGILEQLAAALKAVPVMTAVLNINSEKTNAVLGAQSLPLFGKGFIRAAIEGLSFRVRPETFLQVNPAMTGKLYGLALELAAIGPEDTVLDLYCGVGGLTLLAAKRAKRAVGVEVVAASIEEAKQNAKENGVENALFYCGATEEVLPRLAAEGIAPRIVIVDPPRKGLEKTVPAQIAALAPETLVYIACGPKALVRDALALETLGYRLETVRPVDLFPETLHVEAVALFKKAA